MRVLLAHNYYQQPGGEDRVFAAEASLMERYGHEVVRFCMHNDHVSDCSRLVLAAKTVWNSSVHRELQATIRRVKPDICHFHNTFPLISPAAFHAAKSEGIPVVLTLHNFRLLCPGATFLRQGVVCQDCKGKLLAWPAVAHACYRRDRAATATVAAMLFAHRLLGTWQGAIDRYIALTRMARERFVEGGIAPHRIVVKSNFIDPDPGFCSQRESHALFVGRLSPEKGVSTLLEAWRLLDSPIQLRIAGDGPEAGLVADAAKVDSRIRWLGRLSSVEVMNEMKRARCLIAPSIWFEGGVPLTVLEAFATGLPVLASSIGAMEEEIGTQDVGLLFRPSDAADLAARVSWCWEHPERIAELGNRARARFEACYTAERNYRELMEIYLGAANRSLAMGECAAVMAGD
ncbi:MAG TPA: glycosyltransferase [Bryobacteraceae bacterium]|nr:glycosyltransferase [Bryobacteraceae bacterium]